MNCTKNDDLPNLCTNKFIEFKIIYFKKLPFTRVEEFNLLFTLIFEVYKINYPDSDIDFNQKILDQMNFLKISEKSKYLFLFF